MRVNIYAEEISQDVEIIEKEIDGHTYTGIRFYLYLPATAPNGNQIKGKFIHRPDDDDSSAVTFWGKGDAREVFQKAIDQLDQHYEDKKCDPG